MIFGHIAFGCPFAATFWRALGVETPLAVSVDDAKTCPLPAAVQPRSAATLRHLCLWHLWKHRNGVVFQGLQPSLDRARKNCRDDAVLWRARLPSSQQVDVDTWLVLLRPQSSV